ncbi:RNA polymerase sigma factor [Pedobacter panaciterrae]|jgi:RNA polymerase sigma factor, sigma-70 family|uniref:Sigma-70 family RNA polymerase sigma factor n=1 Tax=Pedobacter panaciterrae TaxID=363849 RepID=A0ABU8NP00_9SPHI|nr:sigma-70 family RNA polymerase sigma factor [Pedobacter panaciterrae]NQX55544.1 sigma-70 family RNA polymerase sigma factor [Pedobacter panaciterrae]
MQQQQTDQDLIAEVLMGNTSAYSELVKRHQRFVFTLAIRFAKNREDAEEIAQDCFVKAYKALGTFKQTSKFSTWLYTITYTTAMSFLRKKRIDTQSIHGNENELELEGHKSDLSDNLAERKSTNKYLDEAISTLSNDDIAIVTLFYKGEQSLEEIAAALNMPANTVKVRLHRARARLKERLEFLLKDEVKELLWN